MILLSLISSHLIDWIHSLVFPALNKFDQVSDCSSHSHQTGSADEVGDDVHGDREDDGGVALVGDVTEGLEVSQLRVRRNIVV